MPSLYALLVGINEYRVAKPLLGCRNDVARVEDFLTVTDPESRVRVLTDRDATRDAIITAFRRHLGRARPGDSALFWFSGHGSQVPVPEELWHLEPSGMSQTLVCADSRADGRPDLLDRELGVLISEVAVRGVHVVAVLDCCHSAGGTRQLPRPEPDPSVAELIALGAPLAARWVEPGPMHAGADLLPHLTRDVGPGRRGDHVALAACRNHQLAYEIGPLDHRRGAFTTGLLEALGRLGPRATYRDLLAAARCRVENSLAHQVPVLYPADSELIDQPFLGGLLRRPDSPLVLRHVRGSWEINAGRIHGLMSEDLRVALPGEPPLREARVVEVMTERSRVEPFGWQPDADRQYPVVFSHVASPSPAVVIGGRPVDDPDVAAAVADALAISGPGGSPSPHLRAVGPQDDALLRVSTSGGKIRIAGFDGTPMTGDLLPYGIDGVVSRLEHLARWLTVKTLSDPGTRLTGAVQLEVVRAGPGMITAPRTGGTIAATGPDGAVLLEYDLRNGDWRPPQVFLRLRNLSDRRLYCVILDLTDQYAIHPDLFPGDYVEARRTAAAFGGDPVQFALPDDVPLRPGAETRDWIQVLVAEEEFDSTLYRLDRLGAGGSGPQTSQRVARRAPRSTSEWSTTLLPVITRVPATRRS